MKENILNRIGEIHKTQRFVNCAIYAYGKKDEQKQHRSFLENILKDEYTDVEYVYVLDEYFKDLKKSMSEIQKAYESHKSRNK
jgi:hypothetical protein